MLTKSIKIGLLGIGNMGRNHLRNLAILKQVELLFIYDHDIAMAQQFSEEYDVAVSSNLEEDMAKVDAVIIATPTFTHSDYIKLAARHVKNIFVEKPLTDCLETSREIARIAKEKQLNIQVGFIERFNPAVEALMRVLKHSKHVISIDFTRTNKVSSRITDVDVITDLMIHDIDLALHINGKAIDIQAHGYMQNGIIEYARAVITHETGTFSHITASRITEKRIRHISATCTDMYVDTNLLSKELFINKQSLEQYLDNVSISSKKETIDVRPQEALLLELMAFIRLCNGKTDAIVPGAEQGLNAMEVAGAIQRQIHGSAK